MDLNFMLKKWKKLLLTLLSFIKIVPRLFIKLNNLGIMLSDANNTHKKQEILGLHHHFYMYVKLGTIGLLVYHTKYVYNTKMQCIVISLYISWYLSTVTSCWSCNKKKDLLYSCINLFWTLKCLIFLTAIGHVCGCTAK